MKFVVDDIMLVVLLMFLFLGVEWFECEVYDMYGILFFGYLDLCCILMDYGFDGYLLCKDFLVIGFVEVCYDDEKKCVVYELVWLN